VANALPGARGEFGLAAVLPRQPAHDEKATAEISPPPPCGADTKKEPNAVARAGLCIHMTAPLEGAIDADFIH